MIKRNFFGFNVIEACGHCCPLLALATEVLRHRRNEVRWGLYAEQQQQQQQQQQSELVFLFEGKSLLSSEPAI